MTNKAASDHKRFSKLDAEKVAPGWALVVLRTLMDMFRDNRDLQYKKL
jgi:hypothetical protein